MSRTLEFPKGFLWGTATAAHQIEGNNKNCDWWEWEVNKPAGQEFPKEPSGIACDSYNRYHEDFELCVQLNNNSVRFSVEWARLEPKKGEFDQNEFEHYKKVIKAAKDRYLKTFITLHHFTSPTWVRDQGGWHNPKTAWDFERFAKKCAEEFGDSVDMYLTINEPQVYNMMSYLFGIWPPNKKNWVLAGFVQLTQILAHRKAYDAIKMVNPKLQVGIVKNIMWIEYAESPFNFLDKFFAKFMYFLNCDTFLYPILDKIDAIGLNYYFTNRIEGFKRRNIDDIVSDLHWWIYPKGLEMVLLNLRRFKKPIYITENGVADAQDTLREEFIRGMLNSCHKAIQEGTDVRGYFHWSLIDNFEWHRGYEARFGLVEIDRENNLARKPRKSFYYYANISKNNKLEIQ